MSSLIAVKIIDPLGLLKINTKRVVQLLFESLLILKM